MGSCAHSHGRSAAIRRSALSGVVTVLVLLSGCAVGGDEVAGASPEPRAELAEKAEVAAENAGRPTPGREQGRRERPARNAEAANAKAGAKAGAGAGGGAEYAGVSDGSGSQAAGRETSTGRPEAPWTELVSLDDAAADHGSGPAYADLARIEFSERGDELAIAVTVRAVVPGTLADREVQGLGIDLFRSSGEESDYQVFLDGGGHGWRAFLQTPDGFVDFPGTFAVEGRTLRVVVPWHAVGGREEAEASVFVDWSSGVGRLSTDGTTRVGLPADRS